LRDGRQFREDLKIVSFGSIVVVVDDQGTSFEFESAVGTFLRSPLLLLFDLRGGKGKDGRSTVAVGDDGSQISRESFRRLGGGRDGDDDDDTSIRESSLG
jgi:hypothetical protein